MLVPPASVRYRGLEGVAPAFTPPGGFTFAVLKVRWLMKSARAKKPRVRALPYASATSGKRAVLEMAKTLEAIGASGFGCYEDFDKAELLVQFEWRGRAVSIRSSAKGYGAIWLRRNPYTSRMRITRADYERRALEKGKTAAYSMLRDWLKGQVTAVETGLLSFEQAFLAQITLPSGETVLERIERDNVLMTLPAPPPAH
jgi:hypothetical protein